MFYLSVKVFSVHGILFDNKGKADAILITHDHYDHFDKTAISQLSSDKTEIILNNDSYKELGRGIALKNGETHGKLLETMIHEMLQCMLFTPPILIR